MQEESVILTDSTHSVEKGNNVIKTWNATFIIHKTTARINISTSVVYFKYAYMHSWFGYYFAVSCLFSDNFVNSNKHILDEHDYCEITFTDGKGSFKIKGKPFNKTFVSKQLPNSETGNPGLHQWTCIYYSDILLLLDKEPVITSKEYDISKSSIQSILSDSGYNGTIQFTPSIGGIADKNINKLQKATVKNKSLKESILSITSNLKINDTFPTAINSKPVSKDKKQNKHTSSVESVIDVGYLYPFRIGTNVTGTTLFISYYKDMLKITNPNCSLLCSFTEGGLSNNCLQITSNVSGYRVYMSSPITYSLVNDYTDYIYSSNKCFIEIDYSYQSTKLIRKHKLQNILELSDFFKPTEYITSNNQQTEKKTFKFSTSYSDRQKCASTLLNAFYSNAKYVFRTEEGLLPTTFFTTNNGNIIWSLVDLYHVAIINKIQKNSGPEVIHLKSQINGIIMEAQPYAGKPGLLTMTQYLSLSRPALFKNI